MAGGRMHILYPTPLNSYLAMCYRNHQKNLAYFSHLAPLVLFFFTKRQCQKGGGAWYNGLAPKYAPVDRIWTMRGPRLFDHTDRYRYSEEQIKKVRAYSDVLFSRESIGEENKKKVLIVRDEASHFFRGPRFQPV